MRPLTLVRPEDPALAEAAPAGSPIRARMVFPEEHVDPNPVPTARAERMADTANKNVVKRAIFAASSLNLIDFLQDNANLFERTTRHFDEKLDVMQNKIHSGDPKLVAKGWRELIVFAGKAFDRSKADPVTEVNVSKLGTFTWADPVQEQYRLDLNAAYNQMGHRETLSGIGDFGLGTKKMLQGTSMFVSGPAFYYPRGAGKILSAVFSYLKMNRTQRNLVGGGIILAATIGLGAPIWPGHWLEAPNAAIAGTPLATMEIQSCDANQLFANGRTIFAFEQGMRESATTPVLQHHYRSALAGGLVGVHPAILLAVSRYETVNNTRAIARGSSAEGAYQVLTETRLHLLSAYATKTPTYKTLTERVANGTATIDEADLLQGIDTLRADYRRDQAGTIAKHQNRQSNSLELVALNSVNRAGFGGELMSLYIQQEAPELSIAALEGKGEAALVAATGYYYTIQLMGPEGSKFFRHLAQNHPNMRVDNAAGIVAAYKDFKPGGSDARAQYFARYFPRIAPGNPDIFTGGVATTFGQTLNNTNNRMASNGRPGLEGMRRGEAIAQETSAQCEAARAEGQRMLNRAELEHRAKLKAEGHEYRSVAGAAWEKTSKYVSANTPVGVKAFLASTTASAVALFTGAVARPDNSTDAAPAPVPGDDIGNLIQQQESGANMPTAMPQRRQQIGLPAPAAR